MTTTKLFTTLFLGGCLGTLTEKKCLFYCLKIMRIVRSKLPSLAGTSVPPKARKVGKVMGVALGGMAAEAARRGFLSHSDSYSSDSLRLLLL